MAAVCADQGLGPAADVRCFMENLTTAPPGIVYVSRQWGRLPVTNMFDVDSEQTTDPAEACVALPGFRMADGSRRR